MNSDNYYDGNRFITHRWVVDVYKCLLHKELDNLYKLDCIGSQFLQHGVHDGIDTESVKNVCLHIDEILNRYRFDPHKRG